MIRTKGEPGTGDVIQAVRHMRTMNKQIRELVGLRDDEVFEAAKQLAVPVELARYVHDNGRLPVVNFAAGGVATPADAALMMELGAEGVFVGSGIFSPATRPSAPPPSSRPPPTGRTPICWHDSPRTSARPWSASTRTKSRPSWPPAASDHSPLAAGRSSRPSRWRRRSTWRGRFRMNPPPLAARAAAGRLGGRGTSSVTPPLPTAFDGSPHREPRSNHGCSC